MYIAGARMIASYPVMPLSEKVGLSVAVTSLAGVMGFGFTADWDAAPDIDDLAIHVDEALAELSKAAGL
jgi:diacylglycerol O-acyltransferase